MRESRFTIEQMVQVLMLDPWTASGGGLEMTSSTIYRNVNL